MIIVKVGGHSWKPLFVTSVIKGLDPRVLNVKFRINPLKCTSRNCESIHNFFITIIFFLDRIIIDNSRVYWS